jgi:tripartite ATP-independent transporter DctM subunit
MIYLAITFIVLLAIGMPVAISIGIASLVYFHVAGVPLQVLVQKLASSTQSFSLLAVPFFVLAGNLMNETGITRRLIKFSTVLTGHMVGGLAQVSVMLSLLMGGISGSAVADAAMESRILGPHMTKRGFNKGFTAAILAMGGLITATFPPGIGLILYGVTGEVSIGRMFMAGVVPSLLMTIFLMAAVHITSKKRNYARETDKAPSLKEVFSGLIENIWAIIFPVILIVGIRTGWFTPSEVGACAVVYALIVGIFLYRELTWAKLFFVLKQTGVDLAGIMFIIICSNAFGYALVTGRLPQTLASFIIGISSNKYLILLIVMLFVFIAGMFMEATANVLILTPIFLPIMKKYGFDPVHFGTLFMILVTMGGMTPPIGVTMYTTCSILGCPVEVYSKESLPFVIAIVLLLLILAIFPNIVLFIPNLVFGASSVGL